MACVLVPITEAIIATAATKALQHKGNKYESIKISLEESVAVTPAKLPFSRKLKWLTNMLWGGSALLVFEHIWHGEIVPYAPFLTGAISPSDTAEMLHEMSTVGVTMSLLVTAAWGGMVVVSNIIEKRPLTSSQSAKEGL